MVATLLQQCCQCLADDPGLSAGLLGRPIDCQRTLIGQNLLRNELTMACLVCQRIKSEKLGKHYKVVERNALPKGASSPVAAPDTESRRTSKHPCSTGWVHVVGGRVACRTSTCRCRLTKKHHGVSFTVVRSIGGRMVCQEVRNTASRCVWSRCATPNDRCTVPVPGGLHCLWCGTGFLLEGFGAFVTILSCRVEETDLRTLEIASDLGLMPGYRPQ